MEDTVDSELQACIAQLNADQKKSLLSVIRSFMSKGEGEKNTGYTSDELEFFYERRADFMKAPDAVYTIEESHARIPQKRG